MAGMSETCNHVTAAMFRIEAAIRLGLTNPASTSTAKEWLPCHKEVSPVKIKNLNFNMEDLGQRGKKKRSIVSTPKKIFNPVEDTIIKLLSLSAVTKPNVNF